jgi:DNA primase
MEIQKLKTRLNIIEVAQHLGIKIGKNNRSLCPFHPDKTPSLQFSKEKGICTCFSSQCTAGTMDIVSLTEKYKNISAHEALKYLTALAGGMVTEPKPQATTKEGTTQINYQLDFEQMQSSFLSSSTARNYAESRKLDWKKLQIGYNAFKENKFNYLRGCITFGLSDKQGKIVSMYGRSVRDNDTSTSSVQGKAKHYYTANRKGLYPNYPKAETSKLLITESVIDTATLQQIPAITKDYELLAAYGTNGITEEHKQAIKELKELEEIIFFFDGDEAGRSGAEARAKELQELLPGIKITHVETPEGEDINSLSIGHPPVGGQVKAGIFTELLNNRKPFSFSVESSSNEKEKKSIAPKKNSTLNTSNPYKISYPTETAIYHIKGGIPKALDSLKITLEIENIATGRKSRTKPDLYEDKQVEKISREAGEKLGIRADLIELDLSHLTDLLDGYREHELKMNNEELKMEKQPITPDEQRTAIEFLKQTDLIKRFNERIEKAGITGEENNRIFLFVIATSYKMPDTLHALIQGSSGSGKTYLSRQITDLMPKEDLIRLTRVTESSFYNYGEYELQHKLIVLEDVDGLKEEAEFAFRELQSNGEIISSTSTKDEGNGQIKAQIKKVRGPIGSIATTTRGEIYEDNMSRIFLLAVDESKAQTNRIISYQNRRAAGGINKAEERETRMFIQNCIRMLKPYEVINPYANKILLPQEAHKIRRLTELYHAFINQITLINQYQRSRASTGALITEKEDIATAIEIMFESIILKIDELDGSLRQFYEDLKAYIIKQGNEYQHYQFTQREIRQALNVSKSQLQRYVNDLLELEYMSQSGGYANRGFTYKITYWDNIKALRDKIKNYLQSQLDKL